MCINNLLYYKKFLYKLTLKSKIRILLCIYPITINVSFTIIDYNLLHLSK